jgi:hypothetical protein
MGASIADVIVADLVWQKKSAHMSAKRVETWMMRKGLGRCKLFIKRIVISVYATCRCELYKL